MPPQAPGVWYVAAELPDGACGGTSYYGRDGQAPINFGCCQHSTIWGNDVFIDTRYGKGCNLTQTVMHETGHIIGLGHTTSSDQVMFWFQQNPPRVSRNFGDTNGQLCIYQLACEG